MCGLPSKRLAHPPADLDAMEQALQPEAGVPSPVSRFVLVHQGKAELNEVLPETR